MLKNKIRTRPTARIEIPVQLSRLRDMAYNLWWTWSPEAHLLFNAIDPDRWRHYRNPIELLVDLEPERWHQLQNDPGFIRDYREVIESFDAYVLPDGPTWFEARYPDYDEGPIAYFCTEFGWHESLQIYSGGLGVLAGDHTKAASDLALPFVGVGLMYKHGYFRQTIDADGQQQHFYPDYDLHRLPLLPVVDERGREIQVELDFPGRKVRVRVWKADVGRVSVLLLDTDVPENHPADRPVTSILYVRGREMRLCQELVLGLGGFEVLKALGIAPAVWHMNEGHSALLALARARESAREASTPLEEILRRNSKGFLFTTHTPVPAGNESFEAGLMRRYLAAWSNGFSGRIDDMLALGRAQAHDVSQFNMTALGVRASGRVNGVSQVHGRVADEMWRHLLNGNRGVGVEAVTNGVHQPTWLGPEMGRLLREHVGGKLERRLLEPDFGERVEAIPAAAVWSAHAEQKCRLIEFVRERVMRQLARHGRPPGDLRALDHLLDPDMMLVGFARRFATYKRADLLLRDLDRLREIAADVERPVQFLFAGKAHPADRPGQDLIRRIWEASSNGDLAGRVLFIENYDMRVGRYLVQGVDLWLNNPRRPQEASGTSGMKVAMNGGLNCSVLDGWWCEGYDPAHGWVIGGNPDAVDLDNQDDSDSEELYRLLAEEIVPCFYRRDENGLPQEWIARMKRAIGLLSPRFCTQRMVREYVDRFYLPGGRPPGG